MAVVMLHNLLGYALGFAVAKALRMNLAKSKAISIEVGMQNSGLASSLALMLDVSQVTIRKDLDALEKSGIIIREHGYAVLNDSDDINTRFTISTQLYNSNVVAFNYYHNLFGTKFIKKIFKIKEKERIE